MRTHTVGWRTHQKPQQKTESFTMRVSCLLPSADWSKHQHSSFCWKTNGKKGTKLSCRDRLQLQRMMPFFFDKGALRKAAVKVGVFQWVTFNSLPPFPPSFLPKLPPSCLCTHRDQQVRESPQVTNCQPVCPTRLLAIRASVWACVYKNIE